MVVFVIQQLVHILVVTLAIGMPAILMAKRDDLVVSKCLQLERKQAIATQVAPMVCMIRSLEHSYNPLYAVGKLGQEKDQHG